MSFNRCDHDTGAYRHNIQASVQPGYYSLGTPPVSCKPCYPATPHIRLQHSGNSVETKRFLIDIDSELQGITRKKSHDPNFMYKPGDHHNKNILHFPDCEISTDDTRMSNPPCTLRSTGWNRFEELCLDPQHNIEIPFAHNVNNRLIAKDNHRPVIPRPIDVDPSLPEGGDLPCEETHSVCANSTGAPSVHWRKCKEIQGY